MSTRQRIITEDDVSNAVMFLQHSAVIIGGCKQRLVKATHMLRHIEAIEFMKAEGSQEVRRSKARMSQRYKEAIFEEAKAAGKFEEQKAKREHAAMVIETWRSEMATIRALKL